MKKIRVGFAGLGRIADVHFPGYRDIPDAELCAVCDVDEATMLRRKKEWNVEKGFVRFEDMLRDPDIDAVEILTPTMLHEEMAVQALEAGKHVAVQKPMANTLKGADRMIAAANRAGRVLKVSDNYMFYPPIMRAKAMIRDGAIGKPTNIRIKLISGSGGWQVPPAAWEWRVRESREGRGLQTFDHGHHLWATAWFLLGEVERVAAWIDSIDGVVDSPAVIMWKYRDAVCYGMCEYCHEAELPIPSKYYANDEWIEVTGTRGIIVINRCTGAVKSGPSISFFDGVWHDINMPEDDWIEGFKGSTRNFIGAILDREEQLLSAEEGRKILKFSIAVQKSNRLHREVYLDELDRLFPGRYAWSMKRKSVKASSHRKGFLQRLGFSGSDSRYAGQAHAMICGLPERFDPNAVAGWDAAIGIRLLAEGGVPEMNFSLVIRNGTAAIMEGTLPDNAVCIMTAPAGTWAAILLKKKRVEMAFIQGRLKLEGKADEALKLRPAFDM
jgi:predicted dehydrogenase